MSRKNNYYITFMIVYELMSMQEGFSEREIKDGRNFYEY